MGGSSGVRVQRGVAAAPEIDFEKELRKSELISEIQESIRKLKKSTEDEVKSNRSKLMKTQQDLREDLKTLMDECDRKLDQNK